MQNLVMAESLFLRASVAVFLLPLPGRQQGPREGHNGMGRREGSLA